MSDFTTELRFICETYAGLNSPTDPMYDIDEIIERARPKLFNFDYPIFDPAYKKDLESKIISHFYTREIGVETVGLFKHRLKNKMREIMPYYNQLYNSEKLVFDPFINTDYTDENHTDTKDNGTANGHRVDTTDVTRDKQAQRDIDELGQNSTEYGKITDKEFDENRTNEYDSSRLTTHGKDTANTGTVTDAKTGRDTDVTNPIMVTETLTKHSDTPQGSVNNVIGNQSNYLSDVTQVVNTIPTGQQEEKETVYNSQTQQTLNTHVTESGTTNEQHLGEDTEHHTGTESEKLSGEDISRFNKHTDDDYTETGSEHTDYESTTNNDTEDIGARDYAGRIFGKQGSETYSEMLKKFRDTFLNIDMDVIRELEPLFMQIW